MQIAVSQDQPKVPDLPIRFQAGGHKVAIYADRVEHGIPFFMQSHSWDQIEAAEPGGLLSSFRLRLVDGSKTKGVQLWPGDGKRCVNEVKVRLARFLQEMAISEGDLRLACTFLGGSALALKPPIPCTLVFASTQIRVFCAGRQQEEISLAQLDGFELGGTGKTQHGGGFVGGGLGVEGAVQGIAVAALLNAISSSSDVNTTLRLSWAGQEAFFHTSAFTPEEGRIKLSDVFTSLERSRHMARPTAAQHGGTDAGGIVEHLQQLTALRDAGALSEEEFGQAKQRLLAK